MLTLVTARMNLEHILLSELSQRKANNVWFHLSVDSESETNEYN